MNTHVDFVSDVNSVSVYETKLFVLLVKIVESSQQGYQVPHNNFNRALAGVQNWTVHKMMKFGRNNGTKVYPTIQMRNENFEEKYVTWKFHLAIETFSRASKST